MEIIKTNIEDLIIAEPKIFNDPRGYFFESYNKKEWLNIGINCEFVQDNRSVSTYGVLRGLHFQVPPHTQAKLITVLRGSIWDIAVDLRPHSLTFGKWTGVELSAENKKQFFIPKGFAHGFVVLSKEAEIFYKCDNYYNPKSESGIYFEDKAINIDWKIAKKDILLSDKDAKLPSFENIKDIFQNL